MSKKINLDKVNFGPLDADKDKNLLDYYVQFGDFSKIEERKKFIVVGTKGSGKSAIKKYFECLRQNNNELVKSLDKSYSLNVDQLKTANSTSIEKKMMGYLTGIVIETILDSEFIPDDEKKKIKSLKKEVPIITKILSPLKIKPPFVEYALSDLLAPGKSSELVKITSPILVETISSSLDEKEMWIIIDDVDKLFSTDEKDKNISFIGGLVAACNEINTILFDSKIYVLILLRSEIYEEIDRKDEEFDKVEECVWELLWEIDELSEFLGERIKWALDADDNLPVWRYWALIFEHKNKKSIEEIQKYLLSKTINGPRDLLLLTNYAKDEAVKNKNNKISFKNIRDVEFKYGKKKLHQIVANHKDNYADIDLVIEKIFRKQKKNYNRKDLEAIINTKFLENSGTLKAFNEINWVHTCTPYRLITIFYRIGFLGVLSKAQNRYIFSVEMSDADKVLIESNKYIIHPAFEKYLELK